MVKLEFFDPLSLPEIFVKLIHFFADASYDFRVFDHFVGSNQMILHLWIRELAGKEAKFKVQVKELRTRVLPEVDEEFAKSLGLEVLLEIRDKEELKSVNQFVDAVGVWR